MPGEHHAICAIKLNCSCQHEPLDIATDLGKMLSILRMSHPSNVLLDNRALIEFG